MKLSDVLNIINSYKNYNHPISPLLRKLECDYVIASLELFAENNQFNARIAQTIDAELTPTEKSTLTDFLATRWNRIKNSCSDYEKDLFNPANHICNALAAGLTITGEDCKKLLQPSRKSPVFCNAYVEFEMLISILSDKVGMKLFCSNKENLKIIFFDRVNVANIRRSVHLLMDDMQGRYFLDRAISSLNNNDIYILLQMIQQYDLEQERNASTIMHSNQEVIENLDVDEKNLKRPRSAFQPVSSFHKKTRREGHFFNSNENAFRVHTYEEPFQAPRYVENSVARYDGFRNFLPQVPQNRGKQVIQELFRTQQLKQNQIQDYPFEKRMMQNIGINARQGLNPRKKNAPKIVHNHSYSTNNHNGIFKPEVVQHQEPVLPSCVIQIPSKIDREGMKNMSAGSREDQNRRLSHMVKKIEELEAQGLQIPVIDTDRLQLDEHWLSLFDAIKNDSFEFAWIQFERIPLNDPLKSCLLITHSLKYLRDIIKNCILAKPTGKYDLDGDVVFTPTTFEILIKDIATTLFTPSKMHMSFGLPTHHAHSNRGAGFCILNKTAMLIHHHARTHTGPVNYFGIGKDVNCDDGFRSVLLNTAFNEHCNRNLKISHVDIFDSGVYPRPDISRISKEFNGCIYEAEGDILGFGKKGFIYYAVDLSQTKKQTPESIHPALEFAIKKLQENIASTRRDSRQMVLLLPTGWDSHQDETACCGKEVNGKMMSQESASYMRFNDVDLQWFYSQLFELYRENSDIITNIYWGLEGGYDKKMYENQIELTIGYIKEGLEIQPDCSFVAKG